MADALKQVKTAMGHDAVILHTRSYHSRKWLGLGKRQMVEITAGAGLNVGPRRTRATSTPVHTHAGELARRQQANTHLVTELHRRQVTQAEGYLGMGVPNIPGRDLLQSPAVGPILIRELTGEVTNLKKLVKEFVDSNRKNHCPAMPEELFDHYHQLIENQVAAEIAADILKTVQSELRPEMFNSPEAVREKIGQQLEKLLPVSGPIMRKKNIGPHVVALIGPTGVGKTTTIAKLAANLKLREKRKVGLITIDTYRIAAIDQLKKYADILGAPLKVVDSPDELREAVVELSDNDYILIDTAGRSPKDAMRISELKNFIQAAQADEVHLVLSSTVSEDCVDLAVQRFGEVGVDKVIFTKIDEAAHVGVILNVARKINKGLSYITTGQDVPDDIEVGRGRRLAQLILGSQP